MDAKDKLFVEIKEETQDRFGIICLSCLVNLAKIEELKDFAEENQILLSIDTKSKPDYLRDFVYHFHKKFDENKTIGKEYESSVDYMGKTLLANEDIRKYLSELDFISKRELSDKFADFCADLEIAVYDASEISDYSLDLYLTRRTPLLRTEAVFVRTGVELTLEEYEKILELIKKSSKVATWTVFVTTPLGIYNIGLEKIINDMEDLRVWLYYVNPIHKEIYGITKGKKNKDYDTEIRDKYMNKLPREPIRAPSQVVKISKYYFSESDSYSTKNFTLYELTSKNHPDKREFDKKTRSNYSDLFKSIIFIDNNSGMPLFTYSKESDEGIDTLVSGFLSAMDNFVSELSTETSSLNEINYKGFYVQGDGGEKVKAALFLKSSADKILKERLKYLIKKFESEYESEIEKFRSKGDVSFFQNNKDIAEEVRNILKV
ncbi:MAG: hypothetical protein EU541_05235 [Promethearchaeota archaeon]|nr:MAG: hypothetical protein EU541_05235 [Candidatus Lokiarchaeota archaeon]